LEVLSVVVSLTVRPLFFSSFRCQLPTSALFPYTTLFRSHPRRRRMGAVGGAAPPTDRSRHGLELRQLRGGRTPGGVRGDVVHPRSEEHTSELQSRGHLVCRLLLEKKNTAENATTPCRRYL